MWVFLLIAAAVVVAAAASGPTTPPAAAPPLCGAYWFQGIAIVPYQDRGAWYAAVRDGNGAQFLDDNEFGSKTRREAIEVAGARVKGELSDRDIFRWEPGADKRASLRVYGEGEIPANADAIFCSNPATNKVWASADCRIIVEGAGFEPSSLGHISVDAIEAPTLAEVLEIPNNSVYGFLDYLVANRGYTSAREVANAILAQSGCGIEDPAGRSSAARTWGDALTSRLESSMATIEFGS